MGVKGVSGGSLRTGSYAFRRPFGVKNFDSRMVFCYYWPNFSFSPIIPSLGMLYPGFQIHFSGGNRMRGVRTARRRGMIRATEASPNGLREETGTRTIHRSASHAKAQSTLSKRSTLALPFLKIFPTDCFRNHLPSFFFP